MLVPPPLLIGERPQEIIGRLARTIQTVHWYVSTNAQHIDGSHICGKGMAGVYRAMGCRERPLKLPFAHALPGLPLST